MMEDVVVEKSLIRGTTNWVRSKCKCAERVAVEGQLTSDEVLALRLFCLPKVLVGMSARVSHPS